MCFRWWEYTIETSKTQRSLAPSCPFYHTNVNCAASATSGGGSFRYFSNRAIASSFHPLACADCAIKVTRASQRKRSSELAARVISRSSSRASGRIAACGMPHHTLLIASVCSLLVSLTNSGATSSQGRPAIMISTYREIVSLSWDKAARMACVVGWRCYRCWLT